MSVPRPRLRRWGPNFAIVALITICILELAFFFGIRNRANLYRLDEPFPEPSGYLLNSRYIASRAAPCYLLRVSSDSCPYCRLDQQRYSRLVQEAQRSDCETVILAPVAGQMKLDDNSPSMQLEYVDMNFGRALKPFVTPETILLDAHGRPVWQQQGEMNENSLAVALDTLKRLR